MIEHEIHILEQFLKNEDCWKLSFAITEEKNNNMLILVLFLLPFCLNKSFLFSFFMKG